MVVVQSVRGHLERSRSRTVAHFLEHMGRHFAQTNFKVHALGIQAASCGNDFALNIQGASGGENRGSGNSHQGTGKYKFFHS
ncbi:hypothetical protein JOS77_00285 [Chromobacterium haemolyticum]|nr:hypothetical protein JOS77_00285 [Chromobacterium haemolyticum]